MSSVSWLHQSLLHEVADRMTDGDVHLLNPRRGFGGNAKTKVARRSHLPPGFSGEANDGDSTLSSCLNGAENIRTVSASRNRQQHIATPGMGCKFTGKNMFKSIIISNCRERRCVGVERDGAKRLPLAQKTARKFRADVLGISR